MGASTLYHLQQRGIQAILLEKDGLTSGTTWHSAGMLWRLRPSDIDIELHTYTREMCVRLEEETEVASWTENGGLFIAGNDERFSEYKRLAETGRYFGIESTVLSPGEVQDVHPLVATDDIVGALYSPTDGTIDPTGIVTAYSKAARKLGARVFEKTPVEALEVEELGAYSSGVGGGAGPVRRVTGVVAGGGQRIKVSLWFVFSCLALPCVVSYRSSSSFIPAPLSLSPSFSFSLSPFLPLSLSFSPPTLARLKPTVMISLILSFRQS